MKTLSFAGPVFRWSLPLVLGGLLSVHSTAAPWWETCELPPKDDSIPETIDRLIEKRLQEKGIPAAPSAPPGTRLRRVMLDLHGRIPTITELDRFLEASSPSEWERTVDDLIASPAFDRFLAHEMNWLLMEGKSTGFQEYLTKAVDEKAPWTVMFQDIIAGQSDPEERKGVDYYLRERVRDLDRMTNDVSVQFFGVNISCAQCHDHPYVKDWTQETYYGMRAFFSRTFENGGLVGERGYGSSFYKTTKGEEKEALPRFLGGAAIPEPDRPEPSAEEKKVERAFLEDLKKKKQAPPPPDYSRRARLIEAALEERNQEWLARSLVNRTWFRLFGYGLVMPLDQMHAENIPSHPELLQWLARDLIEHRFDLRRLTRGIVLSQTYQRDSRWEAGERPEQSDFAVAHPRPLTPRQYALTLKFGATRPSHFSREITPDEFTKRVDQVERSGLGISRWFARPGENFHIAVDEALLLSNSGDIKGQLFNAGLRDEIAKQEDPAERITLAFRSFLNREPDGEELQSLKTYLQERADRPTEAIEQMLWAIMTSSEARFNY